MAENKACCQNDKGGLPRIREAVCIDTNRVYDSCADKDCLADLRVYFPPQCQETIEHATGVRCRGTEILNVFMDVEKVPFNRGCYSVDITFFFKVTVEVFTGACTPPETLCGFQHFLKSAFCTAVTAMCACIRPNTVQTATTISLFRPTRTRVQKFRSQTRFVWMRSCAARATAAAA